MSQIAQKHQDQLGRIKKNITNSVNAFSENVKRAAKFKKFIFKRTLSDAAEKRLQERGMPILSFNIAEAFAARLCGEFSKNEPDIIVGINDDVPLTPQLEQYKELLEGHLRYVLSQAKKDGVEYSIFEDLINGGFGAAEVFYDYKNAKTFRQQITFKKCFDSSLVAFDPLAREPSKKDARYVVELYPKAVSELEDEYDVDFDTINFNVAAPGFSWYYMQGEEKIAILAKYCELKKKKTKLYEISYMENGQLIRKELCQQDYDDFKRDWEESGRIEQMPEPVQVRNTMLPEIHQYILIGDQVLEHEVLVGAHLPYVNFSNSEYLSSLGKAPEEMTRPYLYNIEGAQRLHDQLGISLANECMNLSSQKIFFPYEGIVDEKYITNPHMYDILPHRVFYKDDPAKALPPPREIARTAFPPEIFALFQYIPSLFQNILGSYDTALGINNNQLSGAAIVQGAIQSNSVAKPFVSKFLISYTRVAEIILDLIPKIMIEPQTLPIIDREGNIKHHPINQPYVDDRTGQPTMISMEYEPASFYVKVEAGSSFSAQKTQAMQTIIQLSQAMPGFAQFMNTAGLKVLVDNLDIKGADLLKLMVDQYLQQQQQQAQAMQQQGNPQMMKLQNDQQQIQLDAQKAQQDGALRAEEIKNERMKILLDASNQHVGNLAEINKANAENARSVAEVTLNAHRDMREHALAVDKHLHNKANDILDRLG